LNFSNYGVIYRPINLCNKCIPIMI